MRVVAVIAAALVMQGCLVPVSRTPNELIGGLKGYSPGSISRSYDAPSLKGYKPKLAPVFVEFGVDSCLVADFTGADGGRYRVDLYSFQSPKGAWGAFAAISSPNAERIELGYSALKTRNTVVFVEGYYVVGVEVLRGDPEEAGRLARAFAKRIDGGRIRPDIYEALPSTNLVENSGLYFRGPHAFRSRFGPDMAKSLKVNDAREGVAGKYLIGKRHVDLIKIVFAGREQTLETVDSFLKTRPDRPVLHANQPLQYHTVVESDRTESYVAEYGDKFYLMLGAPPGDQGRQFFEYILRGGR